MSKESLALCNTLRLEAATKAVAASEMFWMRADLTGVATIWAGAGY